MLYVQLLLCSLKLIFVSNVGCAPGPGQYDPKVGDSKRAAIIDNKTARFSIDKGLYEVT